MLQPLVNRKNVPWPVYHFSGIAFIQKKEYTTALSFLHESVKEGADEPETYHSMSICYFNLGDYKQAEEYEEKALQLKPEFFKGWLHLGSVYRAQAKLDDALKCYQKANQLDQKSASVAYRIGEIYNDQGDLNKALELFGITVKVDARYYEAYLAMAEVLQKLKRFDEAKEHIYTVLQDEPRHLAARVALAEHFKYVGNYEKAIELYEKMIPEFPNVGGIRVNYALCLQELGRFDESEKHYMIAFEKHGGSFESLSNYLMGIHYNPERTKEEIFEAHKLWDKHFAPKEKPERPVPFNTDRDKKVRLGFISGGFRTHPVGWMITRALEHLPKDQFEVYCYTTNNKYDQVTRRIHEATDKWQSVIGYNDAVIARMIREDEIDILVELSGHSADTRLKTVALEPAPVIIKWVGGLFNTTGLKSVDYLLTDHHETPEGEEEFYTEKLIRLPEDYICFMPPEYAPDVKELPARKNGFVTFGCFNNPTKVNDEILKKWAEVMNRLPDSRLFLKSKQYDTEALRERIIRTMADCGVDRERLRFEGLSPHDELLEKYNDVDIALDPWPYSGGLTTCEALWMGVPVITKPGPTFAGRHSTTHLINAGLPELVVDSWEQYVEKTVELATNLESLEELRNGLRDQVKNSPLTDGKRFGAHFAKAMRAVWQQWVDGYESGLEEWRDHIDVSPLVEKEIQRTAVQAEPSNDVMTMLDQIEKEVNGKIEENEPENNIASNGVSSKNGVHTNGTAKSHITNGASVESKGEPDTYKIETKDGVTICTPPDLKLMTPYVLLEQEEWYESELNFVREYLKPGMSIADIGAGFGVYSLPAAKLVGEKGRVFAFEPGSLAKHHLEMSKLENGFQNIEVIGKAVSDKAGKQQLIEAETPELNRLGDTGKSDISAITLDAWWQFEGEPRLDLIKIDVSGDELKALKGSENLLDQTSPIILFSIGDEKSDREEIADYLQKKGYTLYEYIPSPALLAEHDVKAGADPYIQNLVAVKEDRQKELAKDGWFHDESVAPNEPAADLWKTELTKLPWTAELMEVWENHSDSDGILNYLQALNYLIAAEQINVQNSKDTQARSQKAVLLLGAAQILINLYNQGADSTSVVFTLVRTLNALGKRGQAVEVMQKLIETTKLGQENMKVDLPFMLPIPEQDHSPIKTDLNKWLMVKTVEAWILLKDVSTWFSGEREKKLIDVLDGNPEVTKEMNISNKLPDYDLGRHSIVKIRSNTDEQSDDFFRSKNIDLIDVAEEHYEYSDSEGVAIIMPCIDKKMGINTAKALIDRAGMPCKVIIAYDSVGNGFIKTLNTVANRINVKYVIYLAQDAFAGRYWLKKAYTQLEKTGKGLLAFNDAKWDGLIASFGMVRVTWVNKIYGDAILYPGYKSHCADDELTAIARATNEHVYDPNISLIEIDHGKGLLGGGNKKDRILFFNRFKRCFEGLAPIGQLNNLKLDYNIRGFIVEEENKLSGVRDKHSKIAQNFGDPLSTKKDLINFIRKKNAPVVKGSAVDAQKVYHEIPFDGYEEVQTHRKSSLKRLEAMTNNIDLDGKKILDIGCNIGYFCFSLAEKGAKCWGLDYDEQAIYIANSLKNIHQVKNCTFKSGSFNDEVIEELIEDAGSFDILILNSVIHWLYLEYRSENRISKLLNKILDTGCSLIVYEPATSQTANFPKLVTDSHVDKMYGLLGVVDKKMIYEGMANNVNHSRKMWLGERKVESTIDSIFSYLDGKQKISETSFEEIYRSGDKICFRAGDWFIKTVINKNSPYNDFIKNEGEILRNRVNDLPSTPILISGGFRSGREYIICNWIEGDTLESYLKRGNWTPDIDEKFKIEIISFLKDLAKKKLVHNDLKPQNILIDKTGKVWIIDFEFSGEASNSTNSEIWYPFTPSNKSNEELLRNLLTKVGGVYRSSYGPGFIENDIEMIKKVFQQLYSVGVKKT